MGCNISVTNISQRYVTSSATYQPAFLSQKSAVSSVSFITSKSRKWAGEIMEIYFLERFINDECLKNVKNMYI